MARQTQAVLAAARSGNVEFLPDGSVRLAGVTLAPDEVEIQATPRPGTAVAHDEGLVVVIDTELTPELRAEGDARELQRAIQDLRREAELNLDDRITVWVDGLPDAVARFGDSVADETLADEIVVGAPPSDVPHATVALESGTVAIGIRPAHRRRPARSDGAAVGPLTRRSGSPDHRRRPTRRRRSREPGVAVTAVEPSQSLPAVTTSGEGEGTTRRSRRTRT